MSNENTSTPLSTPSHDRTGFDERTRVRSLSEKFNALNLLDPRSPTTAFQRTPIEVILKNARSSKSYGGKCPDEISPNTTSASCSSFVSLSTPPTVENDTLELSASSASFMSFDDLDEIGSFDLSSRDLSMIVSDFSSLSDDPDEEPLPVVENVLDRGINENAVGELELNSEEKPVESSITSASIDTEDKISIQTNMDKDDTPIDNSLENMPLIRNKRLKNMFYTPNPSKKRNPLGPVDNICPTTPPSHKSRGSPQVCDQQWKRIQEERKKLGLESDENAQLPLYDITASAPSKLVRKSRLQARINNVMS